MSTQQTQEGSAEYPPGPYKVEPLMEDDDLTIILGYKLEGKGHPIPLATVWAPEEGQEGPPSREEAEAIAHLFAAAPDLKQERDRLREENAEMDGVIEEAMDERQEAEAEADRLREQRSDLSEALEGMVEVFGEMADMVLHRRTKSKDKYPYKRAVKKARTVLASTEIRGEDRQQAEEPEDDLAEQINALPRRLRDYIHDLETQADPASHVRTIHVQKLLIAALEEDNERKRQALEQIRDWIEEHGYRAEGDTSVFDHSYNPDAHLELHSLLVRDARAVFSALTSTESADAAGGDR